MAKLTLLNALKKNNIITESVIATPEAEIIAVISGG